MFEVDEEVANQSHTVKNMIEGRGSSSTAVVVTIHCPALSCHLSICTLKSFRLFTNVLSMLLCWGPCRHWHRGDDPSAQRARQDFVQGD